MRHFVQSVLNSLTQTLLVVLACTLLLCSAATPALAFGNSNDQTGDRTAKMEDVKQNTNQVAKSGPRDMESVKNKSQSGLNGVQGSSERDQMHNSANSSDKTTVREQVGEALKRANPAS
ncbi:MAG: hypothetical protein HC910_01485 [Spirulinaceae cyanobacterium SM2_1_0]|nr:hypothetical protein [Spirulinaceae cyanobacterium SM2_1_0]